MSDPGTSAPQASYPKTVEAPRSSDGVKITDNRTVAPDQTYPKHSPAPRSHEQRCPTCGR